MNNSLKNTDNELYTLIEEIQNAKHWNYGVHYYDVKDIDKIIQKAKEI